MPNKTRILSLTLVFSLLFLVSSCVSKPRTDNSPANHVALQLPVSDTYRFIAFGDTRFHDPSDTEPANPAVRHALVTAIDKEHPAFVSIGGDIVYDGDNVKDWQVWDSETALWKQDKIPIYPAIGNHDLHGNQATALANYFARFPDLKESRFYSVQLGRSVMLILDSALDELSGPQGDWLNDELAKITPDTKFIFFVYHHPTYTSSSDEKTFGGGHSSRGTEQALGKKLEDLQQHIAARVIVINGHVHNYERHEHRGVTYFVTGGGGAHAYPITRKATDLYQDNGINYNYLLVEVDHDTAHITMNKLEFKGDNPVWTKPDIVAIATHVPVAANAAQH
jgi:Icc-related predicted phosphoesterase